VSGDNSRGSSWLGEMIAKPELVPQSMLSGKVVAYECSACGKSFPVPLLESAVSPDFPIPLIIYAAFLSHECKSSSPTGRKQGIRGSQMTADDEDLPATYLLYAAAVILVIASAAVSAFSIIFHSSLAERFCMRRKRT
jgi:hypothetical protein